MRSASGSLRPAAPDQLDSRASSVTEALIVNAASLFVIPNSDLGRHREIGLLRTIRTLLMEAEMISLYRARKGGDVRVGGPKAYLQRGILTTSYLNGPNVYDRSVVRTVLIPRNSLLIFLDRAHHAGRVIATAEGLDDVEPLVAVTNRAMRVALARLSATMGSASGALLASKTTT